MNDEYQVYNISQNELHNWLTNNSQKYKSIKDVKTDILNEYADQNQSNSEYEEIKNLHRYIKHYLYLFDKDELIAMLNYQIIKNDSTFEKYNINDFVHIFNLAINKKYRQRGYCGKLLQELFKIIKMKNFVLSVDESNIPAIKCYEKNGFKNIKPPKQGVIYMVRKIEIDGGCYYKKYLKYKSKYLNSLVERKYSL